MEQRKRLLLENIVMISIASVFLALSFIFVIVRSNVFPVVNALLFLASLFLFKGKYSILALIFFSPFASSMTLIDSKIGSFKTWIVLLFLFYSLFTFIKSKKYEDKRKATFLVGFGSLALYLFFCFLINIKSVSFLQVISNLTYLSIPISLVINCNGRKDMKHLSITFAFSILFSNLLAFSFLYIFTNYAQTFLTNYAPAYSQYYRSYSLLQFRFPGLEGDPNVNSFNILLSSACILSIIIKEKKKIFLYSILLLALQVFAIIGQSKTYLIGVILIVLFVLILLIKNKEKMLMYFAFAFLLFTIAFIVAIQIPSLSQTILRFLLFDDRTGIIEGLTTERYHIWVNYFADMSNHPINLLFGHGVPATRLYGADYHNVFVQLLWEFGLIGLIPFAYFIVNTFYFRNLKNNKLLVLVLVVVLLFSLSLQVAYFSSTYIAFFVVNEVRNYYNDSERNLKFVCVNI